MKTIEPRRVDIRDPLFWLRESLDLISRRFVIYLLSVLLFLVLVFAMIRALSTLTEQIPVLVSLVIYLVYTAFSLFFILADLIVLAYVSDISQAVSWRDRISVLIPEQRTLLIMSVGALLVGAAIWIISLTVNPNKGVISACEEVVLKMIVEKDMPLLFIFKTMGTMLYFLLLALFGLCTFFSIPLVLFHELSYSEARSLSQRAIFINIQPMTTVLLIWIVLFMVAMTVANVLSIVLLPLFGAFVYVGYRHIFIGQMENDRARATLAKFVSPAHAGTNRP